MWNTNGKVCVVVRVHGEEKDYLLEMPQDKEEAMSEEKPCTCLFHPYCASHPLKFKPCTCGDCVECDSTRDQETIASLTEENTKLRAQVDVALSAMRIIDAKLQDTMSDSPQWVLDWVRDKIKKALKETK